MIKYSVAIRTLALNHIMLRRELESICNQSIKPEKVVIYIAQGYAIPKFRICGEEYVPTEKGMLSQRAVAYDEIDTPLLLLLDDDVELGPDSAKDMIEALIQGEYDCMGADVFSNHKLPLRSKVYAALTNMTFPHTDPKYAIRIKSTGSFSYILNPPARVMDSQSAAGPCSLWRKEQLKHLRLTEERWIDKMGFPYNEDTLLFYKLYLNGGKLGIMFDSGVTHLDGRTSSDLYHTNKNRFLIRAKTQYVIWHRVILTPCQHHPVKAIAAYILKSLWMMPIHIAAAIRYRNLSIPWNFIKGIFDGIVYTYSQQYQSLDPYYFNKIK